jgi:hypothetical protein
MLTSNRHRFSVVESNHSDVISALSPCEQTRPAHGPGHLAERSIIRDALNSADGRETEGVAVWMRVPHTSIAACRRCSPGRATPTMRCARLRPLIVVMAGPNEFDPYIDGVIHRDVTMGNNKILKA